MIFEYLGYHGTTTGPLRGTKVDNFFRIHIKNGFFLFLPLKNILI